MQEMLDHKSQLIFNDSFPFSFTVVAGCKNLSDEMHCFSKKEIQIDRVSVA